MNEFESALIDKAMGAIHQLEIKMTEGFSELKSEMKRVEEKVDINGSKFDTQTDTETKRLDKHSEEIDELRDGLTEVRTIQKNNKWWFLAVFAAATAAATIITIFVK